MEIIPAIDIIEGKCVRLSQGDYGKKIIYDENPLEVALRFQDAGIRRLHLVDLDGAKKGTVVSQRVLECIASRTELVIDFGGGIKTNAEVDSVFNAGAAMVTIGSIAVKDKEMFFGWLEKYGTGKILLGADVKEECIAVGAWLETTKINVFDFLKEYSGRGVSQVFCTDIAKDGLMEGPAIGLYKKIIALEMDLQLIASGGVASLRDLDELEATGCSGAIVGKAFYEGKIRLNELKPFLI